MPSIIAIYKFLWTSGGRGIPRVKVITPILPPDWVGSRLSSGVVGLGWGVGWGSCPAFAVRLPHLSKILVSK